MYWIITSHLPVDEYLDWLFLCYFKQSRNKYGCALISKEFFRYMITNDANGSSIVIFTLGILWNAFYILHISLHPTNNKDSISPHQIALSKTASTILKSCRK